MEALRASTLADYRFECHRKGILVGRGISDGHQCRARHCKFWRHPIHNTFVCIRSQWVHVCGDACPVLEDGVCGLTGYEMLDTRIETPSESCVVNTRTRPITKLDVKHEVSVALRTLLGKRAQEMYAARYEQQMRDRLKRHLDGIKDSKPTPFEFIAEFHRATASVQRPLQLPVDLVRTLRNAIATYHNTLFPQGKNTAHSVRDFTFACVEYLRTGWSFKGSLIFPRVSALRNVPAGNQMSLLPGVQARNITKACKRILKRVTVMDGVISMARFPLENIYDDEATPGDGRPVMRGVDSSGSSAKNRRTMRVRGKR